MIREEQNDEGSLANVHSHQGHPQSSFQGQPGFQNRIRHVYLEEENAYGRFVPFLLLKDKLHSQIDTSGTSALAHMCSHNSPYIPLYLSTVKHNDPILNRATNLGHTPLDIAGMYCRRQYVDLLREKGAIDDGKVDTWAIQGANIDNWSGKVDPEKKPLIHWAAYNNFPQVLKKFHEAGADLNQPDEKGNTPIDMAVVNKCYESVQLLGRLGFRPKEMLLDKSESPYMKKIFRDLDRSCISRIIEEGAKMSLVPVLLLLHYLLARSNPVILLATVVIFAYLAVVIPGRDSRTRPTAFFSSLLSRNIVYGYNHFTYMLLMTLLIVSGTASLMLVEVTSIWMGLYFWGTVGTTLAFLVNLIILLYGVMTNTTPSEMFQSHKHHYLWKKIDYLPHKNIVIRVYKNPHRKDTKANLSYYLSYKAEQ